MKFNLLDANVVITGGSEGIGLGLARRFLDGGARVMVTGRSEERLAQAVRLHPGLSTFRSDISSAREREELAIHIKENMPGVNVLINNAGVQRRVSLASDVAAWVKRQIEIDTVLAGPIHLTSLLVPTLLNHGAPAFIANVTSGGAYIPQPFAPVYSACKAALHSYTVNLRHALSKTNCRVIEIIPPAVRTGLAGPGATHGVPLDEFCDAIFASMISQTVEEIGFGMTATSEFEAAKKPYAKMFMEFSQRFDVELY